VNEILWTCQRCGEVTNYGRPDTPADARRMYLCSKCGGQAPWEELAELRGWRRDSRSYQKHGLPYKDYMMALVRGGVYDKPKESTESTEDKKDE